MDITISVLEIQHVKVVPTYDADDLKVVKDVQVSPKQGSQYRISESYRMGVFHIGYRISGEISGIRAHIGRSY